MAHLTPFDSCSEKFGIEAIDIAGLKFRNTERQISMAHLVESGDHTGAVPMALWPRDGAEPYEPRYFDGKCMYHAVHRQEYIYPLHRTN
jgi:hypothetical protein